MPSEMGEQILKVQFGLVLLIGCPILLRIYIVTYTILDFILLCSWTLMDAIGFSLYIHMIVTYGRCNRY